jgi:hypothetical protein
MIHTQSIETPMGPIAITQAQPSDLDCVLVFLRRQPGGWLRVVLTNGGLDGSKKVLFKPRLLIA